MKIKAVIFDMDGVLVDSLQLHEQAGNTALAPHGIKWTQEDLNFIQGMSGDDLYNYMVKKYKLNTTGKALREKQAHVYLEKASEKLGAFPNASKVLRKLQDKYLLGIASGGTKSMVEFALARFNWVNLFNVVITNEHFTYGKPHPEPYLKAIQKLGVQPSECIVVEDALLGIESGKLAGSHVIAVTHSFPEEQIAQHKIQPDKIAHNLMEVVEKIKEIESDCEPGPKCLNKQTCTSNSMDKKKIYDFLVLIEQDEEGLFVAKVPDLQGCATQGKTIEQALNRVKEAIQACIEAEELDVPQMKFIGMQKVEVRV